MTVQKKGAYQSASLTCSCGECAKFVDWRPKGFVSLLGEIRLSRTYYYWASSSPPSKRLDRKSTGRGSATRKAGAART